MRWSTELTLPPPIAHTATHRHGFKFSAGCRIISRVLTSNPFDDNINISYVQLHNCRFNDRIIIIIISIWHCFIIITPTWVCATYTTFMRIQSHNNIIICWPCKVLGFNNSTVFLGNPISIQGNRRAQFGIIIIRGTALIYQRWDKLSIKNDQESQIWIKNSLDLIVHI